MDGNREFWILLWSVVTDSVDSGIKDVYGDTDNIYQKFVDNPITDMDIYIEGELDEEFRYKISS